MGADYETLRHKHPKLIYGHLSAWGRAGPMKDDPGYDFGAFWAHTGVMDIIRSSEDVSIYIYIEFLSLSMSFTITKLY